MLHITAEAGRLGMRKECVMDIGGTRPAPAVTVSPVNRPEPTASGARAVPTQLPRTEVVRQAVEVRPNSTESAPRRSAERETRELMLREFIRDRTVVDPRSREIVHQSVNTRTGEVLSQIPDESLLRLREYVASMLGKDARKTVPEGPKVARVI